MRKPFAYGYLSLCHSLKFQKLHWVLKEQIQENKKKPNRVTFQIDIEKGIKFAKTLQQSSISRTSN
jgi:hypothetical protein